MPFRIIRNDITKVNTDAIVNTANPLPVIGRGTDSAIYEAAGVEALLKERQKIGSIKPGDAAVTSAFALKARYIIHTVGPVWIDGKHEEAQTLRKCYDNCLKLAKETGCGSISFPLISAGTYGFPKADAIRIALDAFRTFLEEGEMQIDLVVYDPESARLSEALFPDMESYIRDNEVVPQMLQGSYAARPMASERYMDEYPCSDLDDDECMSAQCAPCSAPAYNDEASQKSAPKPKKHLKASGMSIFRKTEEKKTAKRSLDDVIAQAGETFQQRLFRLKDERGMSNTDLWKKAHIGKQNFSKIKTNPDYKPKKQTAVALALALELNLDETKDLLGRAGIALSPSDRFDLVISYFIEHQVYDVMEINIALFEHDLQTLEYY